VVERRGENVCAYGVAEGVPIKLNAVEITETVTMRDGDELEIAQYKILFNDPKSERAVRPVQVAAQELQAVGAGMGMAGGSEHGQQTAAIQLKGWDSTTRAARTNVSDEGAPSLPAGRFTFGRSNTPDEDDVEGTMAIDPAEVEAKLAGYEMHPSSRYVGPESGGGASLHSLEDKLIVLIGFVLLLVLVALVIWWVFF